MAKKDKGFGFAVAANLAAAVVLASTAYYYISNKNLHPGQLRLGTGNISEVPQQSLEGSLTKADIESLKNQGFDLRYSQREPIRGAIASANGDITFLSRKENAPYQVYKIGEKGLEEIARLPFPNEGEVIEYFPEHKGFIFGNSRYDSFSVFPQKRSAQRSGVSHTTETDLTTRKVRVALSVPTPLGGFPLSIGSLNKSFELYTDNMERYLCIPREGGNPIELLKGAKVPEGIMQRDEISKLVDEYIKEQNETGKLTNSLSPIFSGKLMRLSYLDHDVATVSATLDDGTHAIFTLNATKFLRGKK